MPTLRFGVAVDGTTDDALSGAVLGLEVTESLEAPATFALTLAVDACDDARLEHVDDTRLATGTEHVLSVTVSHDTTSHALVHGLITERRTNLRRGIVGSTLELRGEDRSVLLERLDAATEAPQHEEPYADLVRRLLERVFDRTSIGGLDRVAVDADHPVRPLGTVRATLEQIAGLHGVRFFVRPELDGDRVRDVARFEPVPPREASESPPRLVPTGEARLYVSGGETAPGAPPCGTLEAFEVHERGESHVRSTALSGLPLGTPSDALRDELGGPEARPIGGRTVGASRGRVASPVTAAGSLEERSAAQRAALDDDAWFLTASTETSVDAYGGVLRPADVVQVVGAGHRYGGAWLVRSVVHRVSRTGHAMRLELARNSVE